MRALVVSIVAACAALVGCHGDTVGDFPGDSSTEDSTGGDALDTAVADDSAHDSTVDSSIETGGDSGVPPTDAPVDVVFTDSGADCGTHPGPAMIEIVVADAGKSFCIDSTEVTAGQYGDFVDAGTSTITPKCPGHDYTPKPTSAPGPSDPAIGVDWCDAYDYCQWAGKRLCGNINGGAISPGEYKDLTRSQWYYACSNGIPTKYPYGDTYQSTTCVGEGHGSTLPVGTMPDCHGKAPPFSLVFDMSGNVAEWEDGCDAPIDAGAACPSRGGWAGEGAATMACDDNSSQFATETNDFTGFRCCSK